MYLVAYDGSELSKGALLRAVEYADLKRVEVAAFAVVPDSGRYASERGWVSESGDYELESVIGEFHEQVATLAPEASFEYEVISGYATTGQVATEIRQRATDLDAEVVFVGSEDAGSIITSVSSVGGTVAAEDAYDVHIVRNSPRVMTDLDEERRQAWLQEDGRPKPEWSGAAFDHGD